MTKTSPHLLDRLCGGRPIQRRLTHHPRCRKTHPCCQSRHPLHHPGRQSIPRQTQHHVQREKTAAASARHQVLSTIGHFTVDRFQPPLGKPIPRPVPTVPEKSFYIQPFVACGQK